MLAVSASGYPEGLELEQVPCPNGCPPDDLPVLQGQDRLHDLPGRFNVVACRHCGLMRTSPRPNPATMGLYYPDNYGPYLVSPPAPKVLRWRHHVKARVARFFGRDTRRLPDVEPGHLLEIGCASGAYLLQMRQQGWSVEGIEFSPSAAATARQAGLQVRSGSLESVAPPERPADVVAAWMVLEHLHQPVQALTRVRQWVRPGGWLVGVVPDAGAFDFKLFRAHWYGLHLPNHLFHYTPETLAKVLASAGWDLVATRWQPNERNFLNSLELWLADRSSQRPRRWVLWLRDARGAKRLRRWLGWLLGMTRQSGRMEFWARPRVDAGNC